MLEKVKSRAPVIVVALVLAILTAVPAFASTSSFSNLCLPAWQGNVTVATGYKSSTSTSSAYVNVTSSKYGGIFWIDRNTNERVTDSKSINPGTGGSLYYYNGGAWAGYAQLRGCQQGWGPNGCDNISGTVNFG